MTPEEITALIQAEIQKALAPVLEQLAANKPDEKVAAASEVAASAKAEVEKLRADVAALGVKFSAKPQDNSAPKEKTILEKLSELSGSARAAFYAKHKDEIWSARSAS